jgi:AraC-like DNA-binding protein
MRTSSRHIPDPLHSVTDFARVALSCGSFDALSAVHFSQRFPPHFHETFAIGVIETGLARLHTRRGEWVGRAGTILAFSPGEVHSAEPLTEDGYTYRMIYPTTEFMRALGLDRALDAGTPLFRSPVIHDPQLGFALRSAHSPLMEGATNPQAEDRLMDGLRTLVRQHGSEERAPVVRSGDLDVVRRTQDYMNERFGQPVRLTTVAALCGISQFQLIRVFRRVVGVPPYAYLVQLRVNRAQSLLCQGSSLSDVAYTCGFSDQSHLTRTFKKALGVPPGQYIRSVRQSAA